MKETARISPTGTRPEHRHSTHVKCMLGNISEAARALSEFVRPDFSRWARLVGKDRCRHPEWGLVDDHVHALP